MLRKLSVLLLLVGLIAVPLFALAQTNSSGGSGGGIDSPQEVEKALLNIISWMYRFLILGATISLIAAAYMFLTSAGDTEKLGKAKRMIMYTVIAIAVAMLSQGARFLVAELLGISLNEQRTQQTNDRYWDTGSYLGDQSFPE